MSFHINTVPAGCADAAALIAELDKDIMLRYPGGQVNGIDAAGFEARGGVFAIAYDGATPAACGAFRPFEGAAEIKRMFVAEAYRRKGLGKLVLKFLEGEAARRGYARAILETGNRQHEAIELYRSQGWTPIPVFGQYQGDPLSVCFEKPLRPL